MQFNNTAITKLNHLISRKDFVSFLFVGKDENVNAVLQFKEKMVLINHHGKVTWNDKD